MPILKSKSRKPILLFAWLFLAVPLIPTNSLAQQPTITISPIAATVTLNQTVSFNVPKSFDQSDLVWTVNGIEASPKSMEIIGESTGTIAGGTYVSPKKLPDNPIVKITVTLKTNKDVSASATVTIVASSGCPNEKECLDITPEPPSPGSSVVVEPRSPKTLDVNSRNSTGRIDWTVNGTSNSKELDVQNDGHKVTYTTGVVPEKPVELKASTISSTSLSATTQVIVLQPRVWFRCFADELLDPPGCKVIDFNRLAERRGTIGNTEVDDPRCYLPGAAPSNKTIDPHCLSPITAAELPPNTDAAVISAINSSKALFSGSVLSVTLSDGANDTNCPNYDWKLVVQAKESPNIFIYNPGDVGPGICSGGKFIIALPVHVLWADVKGYPQHLDPSRTPPARPTSFTDCFGQPAPQTIAPCDRDLTFIHFLYKFSWPYEHLTAPGTTQGSISLSPVIGQGPHQLTFDVQADPGFKAGWGWLNFPLTFEKSTSLGSNLDSLLVGAAYDFRSLREPNFLPAKVDPRHANHFTIRKFQFQLRTVTEIAPTTPHDVNLVEGELVKLPLVFEFHDQPSMFTIYPLIGLEEGAHYGTHMQETDSILRGLAGVDGSFRVPFVFTHNFLGNTPITFDYSYRVRWLANPEPFTDLSGNGIEVLSQQRRTFLKGAFTAPLNPYVQFQATLLRGSLPPDFRAIGTTVTIGLAFTNPGSSEH